MRTINIGNEALSSELVRLCRDSFPQHRVQVLERAPRYLAKYSIDSLPRNVEQALTIFDRWASALAAKATVLVPASEPDESKKIELVLEKAVSPWKIKIKERLKLRKYAARLGLYNEEFFHRLSYYKSSALTLLNPAGELNPYSINPPLRMFLELRVAQLLGSKVGVTNFSFEMADQFVESLFAAILNRFDFISVRDQRSCDLLLERGLVKGHSFVIGDLAFLTKPADRNVGEALARQLGLGRDTAALVINGKTGINRLEDWRRIAVELKRSYREVVVMSNELSSDLPFATALSQIAPVRVLNDQFSYAEYSSLLGQIGLVISNRLHTSVLSMVAGTAVIPVEPIARKIKGLMEDFGYPMAVVATNEAGWVDSVLTSVDRLHSSDEIQKKIPVLVAAKQAQIRAEFARRVVNNI